MVNRFEGQVQNGIKVTQGQFKDVIYDLIFDKKNSFMYGPTDMGTMPEDAVQTRISLKRVITVCQLINEISPEVTSGLPVVKI